MAKGIGLIGNFKGKVGNMVGYKNSASNTANTQGIRVYQPIVKNPKTAAQAEQRAKLAPINATYRALKMIIDRGNEGLPYGNKSRLAWLKKAFKATSMPWYEKGVQIAYPVVCPLTSGSLTGIPFTISDDYVDIHCPGVTSETSLNTVGAVSTALLAGLPQLKAGDQVTYILKMPLEDNLEFSIKSIVLDTTSAEVISDFSAAANSIRIEPDNFSGFAAIIVSREGQNGEHLRSTSSLDMSDDFKTATPYDATSKTAAIESYMSSAAVNSDWAEESIQ